eukprot:2975425-Amphidinium_carterae.2
MSEASSHELYVFDVLVTSLQYGFHVASSKTRLGKRLVTIKFSDSLKGLLLYMLQQFGRKHQFSRNGFSSS